MNTLHIKYAIEVERTRSITQAADNLFMGQPNLSKAIKELEDNLGFPIFERTSRGVIPTQKGSKFLVYAQNILAELDKMEALSNPESSDMQLFSVSIPRVSYIAKGFTNFVSELDMEKPIHVNIQETNSMQTINNITDGKFNLGIIRYQTVYENYFKDYLNDKKICSEPVWEFEYLSLMSKNHPLANAKKVLYDDLKKYIEIVHNDNTIPYLSTSEKEKAKKSANKEKRIYVYERCNQFDLLSNIPSTFMWVSPVPDDFLNRYNLVQRKCYLSDIKYKDLLIYSEGYKFTSLDKKFIDKLYESKNELSFKEYY